MNANIETMIAQASTEEKDGFIFFDKEKFAGLIIQACIDQVAKDHLGSRESWDRSINNSLHNIKTYFGIQQ